MTNFSDKRAAARRNPPRAAAPPPHITAARNRVLRDFQMRLLPEIVCAGVLIMMTTQLPSLGSKIVVGELGLIALLVAARPNDALQTLLRWWPLLATPLLAFASTLWSDLPAVSARYGIQLLITAFVGIYLASLLPPHRFMAMTYIAMIIFCLLSIASRQMGQSATGPVLIGLTGSKNQMAYAAHLLLISAMGCAFEKRLAIHLRMSTAFFIPLALFLIATTHAATAVLLAAAGIPIFLILMASMRTKPAGRVLALVAAAIIIAPLPIIATELKDFAFDFMTNVLHKDPTLTGRTHLWDIADDLMHKRPLLGYGYMSIWMSDSAETLGILRWAGLTDGRQFHFHNSFLQVGVDTGYVGMVVFILFLAFVGLMLARQAITSPSVATSFLFVIYISLMARAPDDVFMVSFSPYTVLMFAIGVYSFWRPAPGEEATTTRTIAPRPRPGGRFRFRAG